MKSCQRCRYEVGTRARGAELPAAVQAHLDSCPACAEFARDCAATVAAIATLHNLPAPQDFRVEVRERLRRERQEAQRFWGREAWHMPVLPARQAYMAVAALAVLIVVLGIAIYSLMPAAGMALGPVMAERPVAPAMAGQTMPATFVQPMLRQHQGRSSVLPWHHDAGYYVAIND